MAFAGIITVKKLAPHLGAEVRGPNLDIKSPLAPRALRAVRDALLRHRVIFFRGVDLDHAQQVAFVEEPLMISKNAQGAPAALDVPSTPP